MVDSPPVPVVSVESTLPDGEPPITLGWQVVQWCERWLLSPMGDGSRLRLTGEQLRFVLWWMSVDRDGRWLFRRGVLRRAKGWGKDPLGAVLALVELVGPSRFGGWDHAGEPVAVPAAAPLVAVAAVTITQTQNTTTMLDVVAGPELRAKHRLKLGISGLSRAVTVTGQQAVIVPVTQSWRSAEGGRLSAVIAGETQHWHSRNNGSEMAAVLRRNLAKVPGGTARMLAITNAHDPSEESVAAADHAAWLAQRRDGGGDILLDSRTAVIDDSFDVRDRQQMIPALRAAYGDAAWVDLERQADEAQDPEMSDADVKRFLLNRITAGARRWMDPEAWDATETAGPVPDAGGHVTLGFDGARTFDSTAIVLCHVETGVVWLAGLWERDPAVPDWEIDPGEVTEAMHRITSTWQVSRAYCDPAWWEQTVSQWCGEWDTFAGWPWGGANTVRAARACAAFRGAVERRELAWTGDTRLRGHVLAAVEQPIGDARSDDGRLHRISKPSRRSRQKIDAAVAAVMAWQARLDLLESGWTPPVRSTVHTTASLRRRREARTTE